MTLSVAGIVPEWTLGDRMRKARELTGLERAEFAAELGISRNTVTNYEHDKTERPRMLVLRSWALRCGVSLDWLQHGDVPPTPDSGDKLSGNTYYPPVTSVKPASICAVA